MNRFLAMAWPMRGRLLLAVLAGAAAIGCGIGLLAVSGYLIATAAGHPEVAVLAVAVVAVRALGIGRGVFRYVERLATHDVAFRILADVRVRIYVQLERVAPLRSLRSGDLLARLVSDVDSVQDLYTRGITPPLVAAIAGGGAVAVCAAVFAPAAGALATGLLVAGVAVPLLAAASGRRAGRLTSRARATLTTEIVDTLDGAAELHAFGARDPALARVTTADAELARAARAGTGILGLGAGLGSLTAGLTLWAVLLLGVSTGGHGALGRVPLAVVVLTALAAFEAVVALPAAAAKLGEVAESARRVGAVLDLPEPVKVPDHPQPLPAGPVHLRLHGAGVRYDATWALHDLDLDLSPGRRIAVVGPSGAGKSTLAAVLLRLRDLDAGSATLNGVDVAAYDPDDVRRVISGCAENPHMFDSTIRANLALARPEATEEELAGAAARARLLDWISSLPNGWDTQVGTGGSHLSGGQRQRLALARVLLADPRIIVLDEPTAHLDEEAAGALTADLLAATTGHGTVLITHDPTGLEAVDEILVLDHGAVVERGDHAALIRGHGLYARMFHRETTLS